LKEVRVQESLYSKMLSVLKFSVIKIQLQIQIAPNKMKQYESGSSSKNFGTIGDVFTVG